MNSILKALAIVLIASFFVQAEVPKQISYQGVLTDPSGAWVPDGVYSIKFRIYDDSIGGNILWETSGYVPLQIHHGMIKHDLGSTKALPDSLAAYPNQWVGITVNLGSELFPRTRLISVPFSIKAQHSDTAKVSLDKTIDAGELTFGTLDTARYSAYTDLVSENKIGTGSNQLASSDHSHPGLIIPGSMMRYEDTSFVSVYLPEETEVLVKSLVIPPNKIGSYFTLKYSIRTIPIANIDIAIRVNGAEIVRVGINPTGEMYFVKMTGNTWYYRQETSPINISPENGMALELIAIGTTPPCTVQCGLFMIEYDAD
jgi:hypothetical protein